MYFDFKTYLVVLRAVLTDKPSIRRLFTQLFLIILLTIWAAANAIFLTLDYILFPRFRRTPIEKPVFIVGNARSGTTFFHRLLCGDQDRFTYFRMWELLFPSVTQKKLVMWSVSGFRTVFPKAFNGLVEWEKGLMPELRKQHYIGVDTPEEDEFLLLPSFSSAMLEVFFPYISELKHLVIFDERPEATRKRVTRFYKGCVKRQLYCYADKGNCLTLVSKNPAFVSKMRDISREFPDGKIVYIMRNPFETIPSLLKLFSTAWEGQGLDIGNYQAGVQELVDGCIRDYHYAMEVLDELPPERYAIVQYTDLVSDPKTTIEQVYERLQLPISEEFEQKLLAERKRQKRYHSENAYSLEQFGVDQKELEKQLAPILERFGFNAEDAPLDQTTEIL